MTIRVRQAQPDDIPWLLGQLQQFSQFFGSKHALFPDAAYATEQLGALIATQPFFIADREGAAVGFITGICNPHFLNPQIRVLSELFWWVDAEQRNGRAGRALLTAFLEYGRLHADWIIFTLEEHSPVNPQTLERRGFRLHERNYLLEIC